MGTKKVKISSVKRSAHLKGKKMPLNKQQQQKLAQKKSAMENQSKNIFVEKARQRDNLAQRKKHNKTENFVKSGGYGDEDEIDERQLAENMSGMLDDEDLELLQTKGANRQRKRKAGISEETSGMEKAYKAASTRAKEMSKVKVDLLPIKSGDGEIITRSTVVDYIRKSKKAKLLAPSTSDGDAAKSGTDNDETEESVYEDSDDDFLNEEIKVDDNANKLNKLISTTDLLIARQQEIERQKYRIGIICSGILEKPEDKMRNINALFELMDEKAKDGTTNLLTVRKVAIISITELFKDILPEYRVGQVDTKMQTVRKATLDRVTFENALLQQFKKFLQRLEKLTAAMTKRNSGARTQQALKMAEVAVRSMCDLLLAHPYFNYVQNIAQLLVYMLNCNYAKIRFDVNRCFCSLFATDKRLDITLFVVRRINHLIKSKQNSVHLECITCLMALKIKNVNLDAEKENELKQKKLEAHRNRLLNLSKKERKRRKKLTELNKELDETRAEENKQTKHFKLTEIIKMVFTIYFRILKNDPNAKVLSAILEGLAEFAHIINLEYFSDLIEVLNNILETADLGYREQLHCIQTIFVILSGQGEVLNIDPIRFYKHFYKNLLTVHAGKNHDDFNIILKTLEGVLVKRRRNMSQPRLVAFIKRLLTSSMQLLPHGTLATLGTIKTTFQLTSVLDILLDTDTSIGSGYYNAELNDPEYCNAVCTAVYELTRLARHYHPIVRKMALHIANGVPSSGEGSLPTEIGKLNALELFEQYDSTKMVFNPPIPVPNLTVPKLRKGKFMYLNDHFRPYYKMILAEGQKTMKSTVKHLDFFHELSRS